MLPCMRRVRGSAGCNAIGSAAMHASPSLASARQLRAIAAPLQVQATPTAAVTTAACSTTLPEHLREFRPNVGVCVFNVHTGLVFAATRTDDPARTWQMPQGGIDAGEDAVTAAFRELHEETGIHSVQLVAATEDWLAYEFPTNVRCRLHGTMSRFRGQAQRWVLLAFEGDDSEVNLEVEHPEFSSWQWMPLQELPESVVSFKRGVYEEVAARFSTLIEQHMQGRERRS